MFFFTSRRVSVQAIFLWSAVVMLCTTPGAVFAQPIKNGLFAEVAARAPGLKRMCDLYCHFLNPAANPSDPVAAALADATPVDESSNAPAATPAPEVVSPPAVDEGSEPPSSAGDISPPAVQPVEKTSGALHLNANFSHLLVWAVAGTGGAILAIF